ncbi:MAG TPA: hypothetical protein VNW92_02365 [Polyangiaceae bacterium]|nr:hypothetical protein [Polyangiaceae bacterium]
MNQPFSKRNILALCALGFGVVLGCGGRAETIEGGGAGGSSIGSGATTSVGGAGHGGTTSVAQGGSMAIGVAGGPSAGSPGSAGSVDQCGTVSCPAIACGAGAMLVLEPGTCCPVCISKCSMVACPGLTCPSGFMLQSSPDDCCPSCVPNPVIDCATGMANYKMTRSQLTDKYKDGCKTDADCVVVVPTNACESGCGYVAVTNQALDDLLTNLGSSAMMNCGSCMNGPVPPCAAPRIPVCEQNQCVFPSN